MSTTPLFRDVYDYKIKKLRLIDIFINGKELGLDVLGDCISVVG